MNDLTQETVIGTLQHWTIHNVHRALEILDCLEQQPIGSLPYIVTAEVMNPDDEDSKPRQTIHTPFLMDFDLASLRIKTLDGVYQLAGPGFFSYVIPRSLSQAVDETTLALAYFENKQLRWALGSEWLASVYGTHQKNLMPSIIPPSYRDHP